MSTLDSLDKRVDKLQASLPPRSNRSHKYTFALELFMPGEQERIRAFLDILEPKYGDRPDGSYGLDYSALSPDEWNELHLWCSLEDALLQGDSGTVEYCRYWLAVSYEEMIQLFLEKPHEKNVSVKEVDGNAVTIYSLDGAYYSTIAEYDLKRNKLTLCTLERIRRYLSYCREIGPMHKATTIWYGSSSETLTD